MNNKYTRNFYVVLFNKYHKDIKTQLELFFEKQRNFQLKLSINRDNTSWQTHQNIKDAMKLESMHTEINTEKNLRQITINPKNNSLEYITLLKIISGILLEKYKKSEHSLYKFIEKLSNNEVKTWEQKQNSRIKKNLINHIEIKIKIYNSKRKVESKKIKDVILEIKNLKYTTDNCYKNRLELISKLEKLLINHDGKKFDIYKYLNYLPDNLFIRLRKV